MGGLVLDLFAGAGGWAEGLRSLGIREVGIEIDRWACATRAAAGHTTIRANVATYPPEAFAGRVEGLIASPPCQDWSRAGRRAGLSGKTGGLVFEVMRWSEALRPLWIACEQVQDVLPIWQEFAWRLRQLGYSTWAGLLNCADFGVPQTRIRAFLLAHRGQAALPPEPTHCRGGAPAGLFGPALLPWVSMADALGWPLGLLETENRSETASGRVDYLRGTDRPAPSVVANADRWTLRGNQKPDRASHDYQRRPVEQPAQSISTQAHSYRWQLCSGPRANATVRSLDEPAPVIVAGHQMAGIEWRLRNNTNANACVRRQDEPAGTQFFGEHLNDVSWVATRPATTVAGTDRIGRPGHKDREDGEAQFAEESVRITIAEASVLQGFPPDYPWQGTKTKQFQQCGNCVPPQVAAAVVGALTGSEILLEVPA